MNAAVIIPFLGWGNWGSVETLPSLIGLCGCLLTAPVCPLLCSRRLAAERDSGKGQASSQESSPSREPQEHLTFYRDPAPGTELRAWWAWCHLVPHSHPLLISEKETEAQSTRAPWVKSWQSRTANRRSWDHCRSSLSRHSDDLWACDRLCETQDCLWA